MPHHFVLRARTPYLPFTRHRDAYWFWDALRRRFPDNSLACVLMTDHLHLVRNSADPEKEHRALIRLAAAFSRRLPVEWAPVPEPRKIPDADHLARTIRYVLLNPSRRNPGLDPLTWIWSTHRDTMGAAAEPWVTSDALQRVLRFPRATFRQRFHGWVSGDPSVHVAGTPAPKPSPSRELPTRSLGEIASAALAATRGEVADLRLRTHSRSLFIALAYDQGWRVPRWLSPSVSVTRQALYQARDRVSAADLECARLCLGDSRLMGSAVSLQTDKKTTDQAA